MMISFINNENSEIFIYFDKEGIDELIDYLNFLKNSKEISMHLTIGNELEQLEKEIIPPSFTQVNHVKIINLDNFD